jgi:hypothetical protein
MSPIVLVALIAGVVFFAFIVLALVVWSIRIRRDEEGFQPAPAKRQTITGGNAAQAEQIPEWLRGKTQYPIGSALADARVQPGTGEESPLKNLLRGAIPEFSTLMELGQMVQNSQGTGELPTSAEERDAALQNAIGEMLEKQPDNTFLHQILVSLQSTGNQAAESTENDRIQVFLEGEKLCVRVDGIEYSDPEAISDPEMREKVRRVLESLDDEPLP